MNFTPQEQKMIERLRRRQRWARRGLQKWMLLFIGIVAIGASIWEYQMIMGVFESLPGANHGDQPLSLEQMQREIAAFEGDMSIKFIFCPFFSMALLQALLGVLALCRASFLWGGHGNLTEPLLLKLIDRGQQENQPGPGQ